MKANSGSKVSALGAIALIVIVVGIVVYSSISGTNNPVSDDESGGQQRVQNDEGQSGSPSESPSMGGWDEYASEDVRIVLDASDATEVIGNFERGTTSELSDDAGEGDSSEIEYVGAPDETCGEDAEPSDHAAIFTMEIEESATYYPWARVWWKDTCGDSMAIVITSEDDENHNFPITDGTYESWHWLPVAGASGVSLEKGKYTVRVENREDGARLDKILFIDADYENYTPSTPQG